MNAPLSRAALANVQAADLAALPLIEKWIAFATVSRDSNLALLDWTEAYLNDLGITCSRTYDDSGQKANLWATLPAHDGESKIGGLVLSGHTDVVPVDGQPWDTDPFKVEIVGDKKTQAPDSPGLQLRRRSRLHRRAPHDRRHAGAGLQACGLHRGRAHGHAGGHCAQGQALVQNHGARF
jgi:hypothetical protein